MRPQKPPKIRSYNGVSKIVMIHQSERSIMGTLLTVNSLSGKLFNFFPQRQYIFTVEQETTKNHDNRNYPEIIIFIIFTVGCTDFILFLLYV